MPAGSLLGEILYKYISAEYEANHTKFRNLQHCLQPWCKFLLASLCCQQVCYLNWEELRSKWTVVQQLGLLIDCPNRLHLKHFHTWFIWRQFHLLLEIPQLLALRALSEHDLIKVFTFISAITKVKMNINFSLSTASSDYRWFVRVSANSVEKYISPDSFT